MHGGRYWYLRRPQATAAQATVLPRHVMRASPAADGCGVRPKSTATESVRKVVECGSPTSAPGGENPAITTIHNQVAIGKPRRTRQHPSALCMQLCHGYGLRPCITAATIQKAAARKFFTVELSIVIQRLAGCTAPPQTNSIIFKAATIMDAVFVAL